MAVRKRRNRLPVVTVSALAGLCVGGCPRPEDGLEPNNSFETATTLIPDVLVEGRVGQGNPDVFAVASTAGQTIVFDLTNLGGEDCAAFTVTAPDATVLYDDGNITCDPFRVPQIQVPGASLQRRGEAGYVLRVPAERQGTYFLTLTERGQADNIFTFSWDYRLVAGLE